MASKALAVTLSMIVAASPLLASPPEQPPTTPAPAGSADTRYCLRVEPVTGSRIETIECWNRQKWAEEGVDIDREWAKEGVRVIG